MLEILAFWAAAVGTATLSVPVARLWFRRFPDSGAGLSLPLGLLLAGWAYFLLRTLSVLPYGRGGVVLTLGLLALLSASAWRLDRYATSDVRQMVRSSSAMLAIFTGAYFAFLAFRSYVPEIQGTEQPMDLLYLNATVFSPTYPPQDPWLAGYSASYYYFGYLQVGFLTQLAGVSTSAGYNLGLATVFASTLTAVLSVALALGRWMAGRRRGSYPVLAAVAAIVLLLFVGSLSAPFELAVAHGWWHGGIFRAFGVEWLLPCSPGETANCFPDTARGTSWYPTEYWWWWRGTRVIPGTITEFPFFSFLLGDLHPHLMALPANLLTVGLALVAWRNRRPLPTHGHLVPLEALRLALGAIVLGGLAFLNAWDVITFVLIVALAALGRTLLLRPRATPLAAAWFLVMLGGGVLAYLPWWLDFRSQASGIEPYIGAGTSPGHAFLQFGVVGTVALLGVALLAVRIKHAPVRGPFVVGLVFLLGPLLAWFAFTALNGDLEYALRARTAGGFATLGVFAYGTAFSAMTAFAAAKARNLSIAAAAALAAVGLLLLYGAELFFVRDVFAGSAPRMNTVFKLSYQAWLLLALASGAALVALGDVRRQVVRVAGIPVVVVLVAAGLVYPVTALPNRTDGFAGPTSVDGLAFLDLASPGESALLRAVLAHVPPGAVVVEATGRTWRKGSEGPELVSANVDYTDAGRLAARSGRPTPIGWYFHEIQWRGDRPAMRQLLSARQDLVDGVYLAPDAQTAVERMQQLGAQYLAVGLVERSRYPADSMPPFAEFLVTIHDDGAVQLFRLPVLRELPTS